ncbi:MAG: HAD family hydrolase [Gemmatimonadales bacterium]
MPLRKLVLFDIDGTILLSAGAGRRAIMRALAAELGSAEALPRIRFDGKTDPQILMELLAAAGDNAHAPERIAALGREYVRLLEAELATPGHQTTVLAGVPELLDRLEAEAGVLLGLLTGNFVEGARLKLSSAGIDPARFRVGAFGTDSHDRSRLPPVATRRAAEWFGREPTGTEVVIIGDTPADVTCGRSIGARAVAVATGSYTVQQLSAAGAHAVFASLAPIDPVLTAILD